MKLDALAAKVQAMAARAVRDRAARVRVAAELDKLAAMKRTSGWPTPGAIIGTAFTALCAGEQGNPGLRALAPQLLRAVVEHPGTGLPHEFRPRNQLGAKGLPLLVEALDGALAGTSRKKIDAMGEANPCNDGWFNLVVGLIDQIRTYPSEDAAAALAGIRWTDERLWLLFRVLAGGYGGPFYSVHQLRGERMGRIFLPLVGKAEGDGQKKLAALLARAGHELARRSTGRVARLPGKLPTDVAGALALREAWRLSAEELELGPPARARELGALQQKLGVVLPGDLRELLSVTSSIGDRALGPPARMADLRDDLEGMIAEHEEEVGDEEIDGDVRGYAPLVAAIPLGTDATGDLYFLATRHTSDARAAPVIRFHHDMALTAEPVASSLGEWVAILFARVWARREGLESELDRVEGRARRVRRR